ncbi:hypothetical protein Mal4_09440 [Maioricimonas rarisocia]|uniref:Uncharacterized protein n=1 Tax=Maioricimonas rarisocia TaxID=2528026 RepID=A0A517Z2G0_9PLAN|nr:hypothetical protein Mal4_09440 [Maioricimonas rarisocia]
MLAETGACMAPCTGSQNRLHYLASSAGCHALTPQAGEHARQIAMVGYALLTHPAASGSLGHERPTVVARPRAERSGVKGVVSQA